MARISLVQAINLIVVETADGKPSQKTLELKRGVNEVDPSVLTHPYIQSHMKAGSASIVPDPMDPEDIAAAAEEIARQARARADAAKALKAQEQQKIDDAMKTATAKPATDTAVPASNIAAAAEEIAPGADAPVIPPAAPEAPAPATNAAPSATEAAPAAPAQAAPAAPAADAAPAAGDPAPSA